MQAIDELSVTRPVRTATAQSLAPIASRPNALF